MKKSVILESKKIYTKPDISELGKISSFVLGSGGDHEDRCNGTVCVSTHSDSGQGGCPGPNDCS